MNININVTDALEQELKAAFGHDLSRPALEALVLEGYRTRKLGIGQVTRLLDFSSRFDAEEWQAGRNAVEYIAEPPWSAKELQYKPDSAYQGKQRRALPSSIRFVRPCLLLCGFAISL